MDQPQPIHPAYLREVAYDQQSSPSIMPYQWTTCDSRNAALASIVPVGLGIASSLGTLEGGRYRRFLEGSTRPNWANYDAAIFSHTDLLTLSPLGYASYLVFKNGGGFDYQDTSVALGLYGTSLLLSAATIPLLDQKNYKGLALNSAFLAAAAVSTFVSFRKIDERASWFALPFAIWSFVQAFHNYQLYQLNHHKI